MEELYPDDYWLDEEDGEEELPVPEMKRKPVSGRLHDEPMVTGYEALERQRGVRRPNRKLTRREKKALKRAQKYEEKLHKEHEKADKKNAKREAKLAARAEKQAVRDAKKNAKKKKSRPAAAPPGQRPAGKAVSGTRSSGTGKKTPDSARDKRITAQQSIPYHEMGRDGICRVQDKFYSKTIRFYDINYQLAQNEDKNTIFENWCDFLNYFDSTIHFQLSFINQHSNMAEYEKVIHINPQEDEFDDLRMEFAQMLNNQLAKGNNGLMRTKYITFGIEAENIREARPKLERIESDILNNFKILGVSAYPLNGGNGYRSCMKPLTRTAKFRSISLMTMYFGQGLAPRIMSHRPVLFLKMEKILRWEVRWELFPIYRSWHRNLPTRCWQSFWRWTAT